MIPTILADTASTLWVCEDCYAAHAGILDEWEADGYRPDREPLALIPDAVHMSAGMMFSEHAEDCANRIADEWVEECSCEQITFSRSSCEGCGSILAGSREAVTTFEVR